MIDNKPIKLESFNVKMDTIVYNFGKPSKEKRGSITKKIDMEGEELSAGKFYYPYYAKRSTILKSKRKVKYKYDKSGNIIEKEWISDDDKNNTITILEYDSKNRLINETDYNTNGKIINNTTLDYNETGSIVNKKIETGNFSFEDIYMYDKDGKIYAIIASIKGITTNVMDYKYDKNNNIVKIVHRKSSIDESIWKEEKFLWEDGFITKISISKIGSELDNLPNKDKLYLINEYNISKYKYYDISNGDYDKGNRSGTWVKYSGKTKQIEYTYQNKSPNMWHRNYDYVKYQKGKVIKKGQYRKGRLDGNFEEYDKKTYALTSAGSYLNGKKQNLWKYYKNNSSGKSLIEKEVTYSNNQIKSEKIFTEDSFYEIVYDSPGSSNYIRYNDMGSKIEGYKDGYYLKYHPNGVTRERRNDFSLENFNDKGETLTLRYIGADKDFFRYFPSKYGDRQYSSELIPDFDHSLYAKGEISKGLMVGEWSFYYLKRDKYNYDENQSMPLYTKISYYKSDGSKRNEWHIPLSGIPENQQIVTYYPNGNPKQKFMLWAGFAIKYHDKYEEWYENGQLKKRFNYEKGHLDGLAEEWYENGQLKKHLNYEKKQLIGLAQIWYENGNKAVEGKFEYPGIYEEKDSFKSWYKNGGKKEISNFQQLTTNVQGQEDRVIHYKTKRYRFDKNGKAKEKNKGKKLSSTQTSNLIDGTGVIPLKLTKRLAKKAGQKINFKELSMKGLEKSYYTKVYENFENYNGKRFLVYDSQGIKVYCNQYKDGEKNLLNFELEDPYNSRYKNYKFSINANVKGNANKLYRGFAGRFFRDGEKQEFELNENNNYVTIRRTFENMEIENIKLEKINFY